MELDRLTDWLWCLRTPIVQCYAISHRAGFVLIDASTEGEENSILTLLGQALAIPAEQVVVHEILLTHGHHDHIGSAAALAARTGGRVVGPALEADVIEGRRAHPQPRRRDWEIPMYEQIIPQVPAAPRVMLDERLAPGDTRDWDNPAVLLAAPGHTPGQLAVWFPTERALIAGDAMASRDGQPMPGVFNVDPAEAATTYATLAALAPDIACFGHGAPLTHHAAKFLQPGTRDRP
ncbi:MAG: MBL fold metallo-hydrolase [Solirubrobacterales bacterium]|nr:MBL fold metallo-hydrolase [Solirubrobacterales bacterium]